MPKKLYVGNLNYDTTEAALTELFSENGEVVSAKLITDKFSGRSKGFAFIEMAEETAATTAMEALNGKEVDGRNLKVNEAIDRPRRNNY